MSVSSSAAKKLAVAFLKPDQWDVFRPLRQAFTREQNPGWPTNPRQPVALDADTATMLANPGAVVLVAVDEDTLEPVGFLSAVVDGLPWLQAEALLVNGLWVRPEYRTGSAGFLLVREFIRMVERLPKGTLVRAAYDPKNTAVHGGRFLRRLAERSHAHRIVVEYVSTKP